MAELATRLQEAVANIMPADGPQLAWIGLGNMGRGMCKNLIEKGKLSKPLIVYNRTKKRAEDLTAQHEHSKVASTVADAVGPSEIIFMCLGTDAAIKETVDAGLKVNVKGKLFVDCSTVHPDTTRALAKQITTAGAQFVASPVFGAPAMADNGQLIFTLAGPSAAVDLVKPYTVGVMARANIDLSGSRQEQASLLKIVGNTFILQMVEALSEGLTLADKSGLGIENLHKFLEQLFPGPYVAYSTRMQGGDYYKRDEPLFAVDLARKDAKHALDIASASGVKMPAVEVADAHLAAVKEHMGEKGDIAGIYGAVRKESGLKFEN